MTVGRVELLFLFCELFGVSDWLGNPKDVIIDCGNYVGRQYVGQTRRSIRARLNEHESLIRCGGRKKFIVALNNFDHDH